MQVTLNHNQLTALIKSGLINESKFAQCQTESKLGDYIDSTGKTIIRTTIYVPNDDASELVSGADIINNIKGAAVDSYASRGRHESHDNNEQDDLAAAMGA